jgi:hypothetical protein
MTCKHALNPWSADQPTPACLNCEIEQLRGTLSLAEEGLANYAQENKRLKAELVDTDTMRRAALELVRKEQEVVERLCKLIEWQPIKTAPKGVDALFVVVPLTAEDDHFVNTSGHPILMKPRPPRVVLSKLDCGWSSLEKAILWMPIQPLPQSCDESPK